MTFACSTFYFFICHLGFLYSSNNSTKAFVCLCISLFVCELFLCNRSHFGWNIISSLMRNIILFTSFKLIFFLIILFFNWKMFVCVFAWTGLDDGSSIFLGINSTQKSNSKEKIREAEERERERGDYVE